MGDEPTNDTAAPRPPDGPRPTWSSDGPVPGTTPPDRPGSDSPYMPAGAQPSPSSTKPRSTAAKGWLGAGVAVVAIAGAALFGVDAAGSSPSGADAGPAAYGAPGYEIRDGPDNGERTSRMGVGGTVASVSDTSFTVNGGGSEAVTVKVTDETTITQVGEDGSEEAIELADLKVGDSVMVRGEPSGDAIAAIEVRVGELPRAPGMGRSGKGDCGPGTGEGGGGEPEDGDGDGTSNQTTSAGTGSV